MTSTRIEKVKSKGHFIRFHAITQSPFLEAMSFLRSAGVFPPKGFPAPLAAAAGRSMPARSRNDSVELNRSPLEVRRMTLTYIRRTE
jgi:hypothetical protein